MGKNKKSKVCIRVSWVIRPELIPVSGMKRLGVFLLPPGWDARPLKGYPQHEIHRYPFIHLGEERHCESKVSCPRTTQCSRLGNARSGVERTNYEATAPPYLGKRGREESLVNISDNITKKKSIFSENGRCTLYQSLAEMSEEAIMYLNK